jgi:hypothetical protein
MESYTKLIEPLLIKMVATNYKVTSGIELSEEDLVQMDYIKQCVDLFLKLNKDTGVPLFRGKNGNNSNNDNSNNEKTREPEIMEKTITMDNPFEVDSQLDFNSFVDENKSIVVFNNKENDEVELSYETDPKLIEICHNNKVMFDEFTKNDTIKLDNLQDSFWKTIDVK